MAPDFVDDVNSWAEAMVHLFECEREWCGVCWSIAEACYAESLELEAWMDRGQRAAS